MKNIILTIMLLILSSCCLLAQSREPAQRQLRYLPNQQPSYFSSTDSNFKRPTGVVLGFHWCNDASIAKSLFCSQNNVFDRQLFNGTKANMNQAQNNANLIVQNVTSDFSEGVYSHAYGGSGILNARSMQFEPTLLINSGDSQKDIIGRRTADNSHPIFGFEYINADIPAGGTNYSFLTVEGIANRTVFKTPWASDQLTRHATEVFSWDTSKVMWHNYYGYSFYVTVVLKRKNVGNLPYNNPVLEIKMPYVKNGLPLDTALIRFDMLPSTTLIPITSTLSENRGWATDTTSNGTPATSFMITEDMLPADGTPVTVSAHFRCYGIDSTDNKTNPKINTMYGFGDNTMIRRLGITAIYKGLCPVLVDYVRIETPHAQQLYRGQHDSEITTQLQNAIDVVNEYNDSANNNARIYRFTDVTEYKTSHFGAARYINKLIGDVFVGATPPWFSTLFDYYVNPPERFVQGWGVRTNINAPYCKLGDQIDTQRYKTYGLIAGYTHKYGNDTLLLAGQLNSEWETYPPIDTSNHTGYSYLNFLDFYPFNENTFRQLRWMPGSYSPTNSFQTLYDYDLWHMFVNDTCGGFQWTNRPWWVYTNNCLEWHTRTFTPTSADLAILDTNKIYKTLDGKYSVETTYFNDDGRPHTAEETRVSKMLMILMGGRGLLYDGLSYDYGNFSRQAKDSGLVHYPLDRNADESTFYNYVMNDSLGGDYIGLQSDCKRGSMLYKDYFFKTFANLLKPACRDTYCLNHLGVNPDELYVGRKSIRSELYKIHRWIRAIDTVLAKSHLVAWHGKGYLRLHQQQPTLTEPDIMNRFLVVDSTRTKRLWVPDPSDYSYGGSNVAPYESLEDQFYDITLLKKDSIPMENNYLLGVSNRRVDPLVWTNIFPEFAWGIKFVPAGEFDQLSLQQGPVGDYWKSMIYKRFGCREIDIKLENPTDYDDSEVAFRITELGKDSKLLKNEFWFNPPFNHVIDTNLLVGQHLKLRMLPGQGKLLNVEVLTPTEVVSGTLDYSNQTKLVAFPCDSNFNANGMDTMGMVRYHSVYSRKYDSTYNLSNVYYRRSLPMNRLDKDIRWEAQEYQLNDTLLVKDCISPQKTVYNLPSNFPSLVVRCDTIDNELVPMVYVVYQGNTEMCTFGNNKLRIIENAFPANVTELNIPWGRQIDEFTSGRTSFNSTGFSLWGIPVINASAHGNYYAWNDSLLGIVAGFKLPSDRGWIAQGQKTNFKGIAPSLGHFPGAYHPSLNTYSTISDNEMDCVLVWEEDSTGQYRSPSNQIFYTRLKYCDYTGLVHYLSPTWGHINPWYQKAIIVDNGRIARLDDPNDSITYHHLPMIHRDVDYYNADSLPFNGMWPRISKTDRVYWQGRSKYLNLQCIFMKFISIADNLAPDVCIPYSPSTWLVEGTPAIMSTTTDLAHPNVAQGKLVKQYHIVGTDTTVFYTFDHVVNDSVAVINFVEYPHDITNIAEVPRTADIWQINHSYYSLFSGPDSYTYCWDFAGNAPNAHKIGSKGKSSHLARLPYINNDKTWEYGHRIYESSSDLSGQNPLIKSYDYLLFKKTYDAEANYLFYGFKDTLGNRSVFSPIYLTIDGREHAIVPKFDEKNKIYSDTLFSNWFKIDNYQDIDMLHFGNNKKCLYLKLQRKDDKKLFSVQTDKSSVRFDYTKHSIHLLNGKSKEYRFAWIKTTKSDFTEMTILGLPPMNEMTKDEMLGKTSINVDENYLDLSEDMTSEIPEGASLFIYPNPANEKVVIFYEQENKSNINISIYGMLGTTIKSVFSGDIEKGKYQYSVNIKDIPAGMYFVRVEGNNKTIVKKLVIE